MIPIWSFAALYVLTAIHRTTGTATHQVGTHFMWHIPNGVMIGLLLLALILKIPPVARRAG